MPDSATDFGLRGKLLIAMPGMGDPRFDKSVVFMCEHNAQGAMGLIVNKATPELRFSDIVEQLEIRCSGPVAQVPVHYGGPVENGRGFVLHSADYTLDQATMEIDATFAMTATLDVVQDIAERRGPDSAIFALGYAGWGPGQLEAEIQQNGWLTCDSTTEIVFGADNGAKWSAALGTLGIEALSLSGIGGRA